MIETFNNKNKQLHREPNDYYATPDTAINKLIEKENISGLNILENSAGEGAIATPLSKNNKVFTCDLIQRSFPLDYVGDYLQSDLNKQFDLAVYNPPFKLLGEFIEKTWDYTDQQWILGRIQILESKRRFENIFSKNYLKKVYVFTNRISCLRGGKHKSTNSMCYSWFLLDKNNKSPAVVDWV